MRYNIDSGADHAKKAIKKHWIEETVVKLTVSKVLTDEAIDRIADAVLRNL